MSNASNYIYSAALQPSSKHEQLRLVERWQQDGDVDARNQLIRESLGYVLKELSKRYSPNYDKSDALHDAALALCDAADKFDANTGHSFLTYAKFYIMRAHNVTESVSHPGFRMPYDAIKDQRRKGPDERPHTFVNLEMAELNPADNLSTLPDISEKNDIRHFLSTIKCRRARAMVQFQFGIIGNRTWRKSELARAMRLSRQRVDQIEKRTLHEIRRNVSR